MNTSKEERDQRVARALQEAACQHPANNRGVDLATADEFCGDCGALTKAYTDGDYGRLPGDEAVRVIAEWMAAEPTAPSIGRVTITGLQHTGRDYFDVSARISSREQGEEHMNFRLRRYMARDGLRIKVTSARH
jgi:hypothetical protein